MGDKTVDSVELKGVIHLYRNHWYSFQVNESQQAWLRCLVRIRTLLIPLLFSKCVQPMLFYRTGLNSCWIQLQTGDKNSLSEPLSAHQTGTDKEKDSWQKYFVILSDGKFYRPALINSLQFCRLSYFISEQLSLVFTLHFLQMSSAVIFPSLGIWQ